MLDTPLLHTMWQITLFCGMLAFCVLALAYTCCIVGEVYDEAQRRYKDRLWTRRRTRQQARPRPQRDDGTGLWTWNATQHNDRKERP